MVSGTLSGIWLGHMTSPDSDNPKTAEIYLATYGEWEHEGPISDGPFCQRGRLTLRAGSHTCTYATGDASVTTSYQSPLELARSSFPNRDFSEDSEKLFALVAPPVEGGLLFTILGDAETGVEVVTREERIILTAASLGAGCSVLLYSQIRARF